MSSFPLKFLPVITIFLLTSTCFAPSGSGNVCTQNVIIETRNMRPDIDFKVGYVAENGTQLTSIIPYKPSTVANPNYTQLRKICVPPAIGAGAVEESFLLYLNGVEYGKIICTVAADSSFSARLALPGGTVVAETENGWTVGLWSGKGNMYTFGVPCAGPQCLRSQVEIVFERVKDWGQGKIRFFAQ